MKNLTKRLLLSTGLGAILGILCVIGQAQRGPANPLPNDAIYLLHAWYNRVIMGMMIGFAGDWTLWKENPLLNALLRGAIIGTLVSVSFGLLNQELELIYFFAGIMWGLMNDLITTWIVLRTTKSAE